MLKGGGTFTREFVVAELYAHLHAQHPEVRGELKPSALEKHLLEQPNPTGTAEQYTSGGINGSLRTHLITLLAQNKATNALGVSEAVSTAAQPASNVAGETRAAVEQKT